jgi:pimeloyl-[acyl-carrier protein] synthase
MISSNETLSLSSLLDPTVLAQPHDLYRRFQERDQISWDPLFRAWIITRYKDCLDALQQLSSARAPKAGIFTQAGLEELEPVAKILAQQMINVDPPDHTRLRQAYTSAFRQNQIEILREKVYQKANQLIDELQTTGKADIVEDFAGKLPVMLMSDIFGLPAEDFLQLKAWALDFSRLLGNVHYSKSNATILANSAAELVKYLRSALTNPNVINNSTLIESLFSSVVDRQKINKDEYIANCIITLVGGTETITTIISGGLLIILQNQYLKRILIDLLEDEAEIPDYFIEELLRVEPPTQYTSRIVPSGKKFTLGSTVMNEGDLVLIVLAAANRDPSRFVQPNVFNPNREDNRHLSFGWGPHFCFGAHLARMEAQISLSLLLRRLGNLSLASGTPVWRENLPIRTLMSLHVSFDRC